jgi:hypothetical protein
VWFYLPRFPVSHGRYLVTPVRMHNEDAITWIT